jgi:DNA-binding MarR family transcriptional regulator
MDFSEQIQEFSTHVNSLIRRAAASQGVSFAQAQFILTIPLDGVSMSVLAQELGIDISTLSRNADKLLSMGLIARKGDPYDKRITNIFLSTMGVSVADLLLAEIDACAVDILSSVPLDLQKVVGDVLEQLNWALTRSGGN